MDEQEKKQPSNIIKEMRRKVFIVIYNIFVNFGLCRWEKY